MDLEPMARACAQLLKQRGETVAVSESSTGGLLSAALLSVAGASTYYLGGGVVYTGVSRRLVLGLTEQLPAQVRSSSEPYAALAAATIRERFGATWGFAETGAAGPTGNRYGDAAGHTCIAVAGPTSACITLETGSSDREANMWRFTSAALEVLEGCLKEA